MARKSKKQETAQTVEAISENPALPCEGPVFVEVKEKTVEEKEEKNLLLVSPTPPAPPTENIPEAVKEQDDMISTLALNNGTYQCGSKRYKFETGKTYYLPMSAASWFISCKILKANK